MSKKSKELLKYRQIGLNKDTDDTANIIHNLEHVWNNLPDDISDDEYAFFLDLVEKLAKMHYKTSWTTNNEDLEKN